MSDATHCDRDGCETWSRNPENHGCICPELRACEERVRVDLEDEINLYRRHANEAYAAALDAAREEVGSAMTEHLPECPWAPHDCDEDMCERCDRGCYCNELRACEKRVAEETEAAMIQSFYWKPSPPHDQHYFADNICAYCVGRSEALSAARKAVAACTSDRPSMRGMLISVNDALAAIDALKKKP